MKKVIKTFGLFILAFFSLCQLSLAAFNDVPIDDDNYVAITYLEENGIIHGFDNGTRFAPDELLTRSQALKILIESSKLKEELPSANDRIASGVEMPLSDVSASDWVAPYVLVGVENGVIQGTAEKKLEGLRNVTTAEFVKMMLELNKFDLTPWKDQQLFTDVPVSEWYNPYMNYAGQAGIVHPSSDNRVYPMQMLRRRDVAQMMYVMALILNDKDIGFLLDQADRQLDQVNVYVNDKNFSVAQYSSGLAVDITQQLYKYFPDDDAILAKAKMARAYDFFMRSFGPVELNAAVLLKSDTNQNDWLTQAKTKAEEAVEIDSSNQALADKLYDLIDQQMAL